MALYEVFASILLVLATVMVVATVIALWRAPDALTRVNLLGPTVGVAVPLTLVAKFIVDCAQEGFSVVSFIKVLIACAGIWVVASVGSFYMGRSIYGVTVTDVKYARRRYAEMERDGNNKA
ncbi:Na+/H+ antiporter subunit G [Corynebacterium flavescens]|uniref:Cation:proton antiporter n=1 Tax=Corynebacterium flavescens TaxID=28028 RepID=A0A1L7CMN2_CORFL|nr:MULTISPECIES: Na+/H+ antiporter subunit G [Corynebacterium]APT87114.1 cation:proton antiporter [Corynebacterium flavescens]KAA8721355.1 Na+/H+ antiporter subunit G [Corynebacterium flavescens]MDN6552677.1 Na+/H+ antiporter subunit G [Corynebacterium flavescens]MDN6600361.1 Na+/H+ antiporter subunit G [Corynebacterium flavescens]GEB97339.1 Na+/H+ antiporter subunit G [Corynebacterium flavescens]